MPSPAVPTDRDTDMAQSTEGSGESVTTVIVAGTANLAIAVAKLVAGLLSGSAAMLSEAAHSFADTTTEVLLYIALRRGDKPADDRHPFGYGKESFARRSGGAPPAVGSCDSPRTPR